MNNIDTFTKKINCVLDHNSEIQDLLSEASIMVDKANSHDAQLLRYVQNSPTLSGEEMYAFCKNNQETLDIMLNEQQFIMDEIKGIIREVKSFTMTSFLAQNTLSHHNNINQINAYMKKGPILGKALPSESNNYFDHSNNKKGN